MGLKLMLPEVRGLFLVLGEPEQYQGARPVPLVGDCADPLRQRAAAEGARRPQGNGQAEVGEEVGDPLRGLHHRPEGLLPRGRQAQGLRRLSRPLRPSRRTATKTRVGRW